MDNEPIFKDLLFASGDGNLRVSMCACVCVCVCVHARPLPGSSVTHFHLVASCVCAVLPLQLGLSRHASQQNGARAHVDTPHTLEQQQLIQSNYDAFSLLCCDALLRHAHHQHTAPMQASSSTRTVATAASSMRTMRRWPWTTKSSTLAVGN